MALFSELPSKVILGNPYSYARITYSRRGRTPLPRILVAGFGQRADDEVVKVKGSVDEVKQLRSVMAAEVT